MNIRFFSGKIRIAKQPDSNKPGLPGLNIHLPKVEPQQQSLGLPKSTHPVPKQIFNEQNKKEDNIFHDLETPDMYSLGIKPPARTVRWLKSGPCKLMVRLN